MAESQPTEYQRGVREAAEICKQSAIRLLSGKSRTNQVDRHTAEVLRSMEKQILALLEKQR
jgi:hypothetical protein